MLKIVSAEFITSATSIKDAPVMGLPEIIMIGRSNVGKSSFINALCNRKQLAYIGKQPGKTRLINLYKINNDLIMTDLPGYGYAKVSKTDQAKWQKKIEEYLLKREEIVSAIHLMDIRHEPQKNDLQMREWLAHYEIPSIVVLTKADKISKGKIKGAVDKAASTLNTEVVAFSAMNKYGKPDLMKFLNFIISGEASY